jgi:hypothetical protein
MLCRNGTRVQSIIIKNALIDPEKCIQLWPVNDGDPVDMLCRMKELWIPKHNFNIAFSFKEYLKENSPVTQHPKKTQ